MGNEWLDRKEILEIFKKKGQIPWNIFLQEVISWRDTMRMFRKEVLLFRGTDFLLLKVLKIKKIYIVQKKAIVDYFFWTISLCV